MVSVNNPVGGNKNILNEKELCLTIFTLLQRDDSIPIVLNKFYIIDLNKRKSSKRDFLRS